MNEVWNLDPLYKGFDDPAFGADMGRVRQLASQLNEFAAALPQAEPLEGLREGIRLMEELTQLINRLGEYASLRQSADTRNTESGSRLGQVMQIASSCAGADAAFREWAAGLSNLDELLERDEVLKQYRYFFHNVRLDASHLLGAKGEEIAARLGLSGGNAWSDLQGYLTSTVKVTYRGKTTNLSAIRNMAYDPDPQVRKDAYEAELACYEAIKDPVAHALNAIKLETISDCALRGFASPLDRTLEQARMKRETLEAMLGAMDEYLPKFWQYLKAKGKALGHENGLPWYDLFAPMGASDRKYI